MEEKVNSLSPYLADFIDYLRIDRAASIHTVTAYQSDLSSASNFFIGNGLAHWEDLDNGHLLRFEASLGTGMVKTTAQRKLSSLRSFLKFLKKNRIEIKADLPSTGGFKKAKLLPKALDEQTIDRLMDQQKLNTPSGLRDRALFELIYGAGLRISEAVELELSALDLDSYSVRIFGKRGKTRINPLPDQTVGWLKRYLGEARPILTRQPLKFLIVSDRGKRLLRQTAYNILERYQVSAGISNSISPHTLRHSFAVQMLKGGADLRVVQELLGHESITTTQVYTGLDLEEVRKRYDLAHPRR